MVHLPPSWGPGPCWEVGELREWLADLVVYRNPQLGIGLCTQLVYVIRAGCALSQAAFPIVT